MRRNVRSRTLNHGILSDEEWEAVFYTLRLSEREQQLIRGVFDGKGESAIAYTLGISTHTVHTYFERLYRKLNISSRCELVLAVFSTILDR